MHQLMRILLAGLILLVPSMAMAETSQNSSAFSAPFHKQARGWYPSFYWSTGRNLGSYYFPNTDGTMFEEVDEYSWDKASHGIIYFYRPDSQWASEELTAPSYYINDEIIFNLRAGSYTYVVLPAGSYDFAVRKSFLPLLGFEAFDDKTIMAFDLNLQADVGLQIDAGSITYIRHSEVSLPSKRHSLIEAEDEMASADVQLVERDVAMGEMPKTRYLMHSFWHPTDAANAEEFLRGDMQEYGWFSVIWPWSNNFMFDFPIFYLPSDIYRKLRPQEPMTMEQELYLLADDKDAYLAAIADKRVIRRNWLAPWRDLRSPLSLQEELVLDRLERDAMAGNIEPAERDVKEKVSAEDDGEPWHSYFKEEKIDEKGLAMAEREAAMSDMRRGSMARIRQTLN
jgi:hypothetical protein